MGSIKINEYVIKKTTCDFEESKREEIRNLSEKIINKFEPNQKSILLIGKIQSGKTTAFMNIMSQALFDDFRHIFVFTGTKNNLNDQTFERINNVFCKDKIFEDKNGKLFKLKIKKDKDVDQVKINENYKNIMICKKGKNTEVLPKFIIKAKNEKILIIDDESDHASNDTNRTKKNKPRSKTNDIFHTSYKNNNAYYLAVTATPHSHALMRSNDFNKPCSIFFTEPGNNYKGIKDFFSQASPIISMVPVEEVNSMTKKEKWEKQDTKSLENAVCEFILKVWALKKGYIKSEHKSETEQKFENFNMIVNLDIKNKLQKKIYNFIDQKKQRMLNSEERLLKEMNKQEVQKLLKELNINLPIEKIAKKIIKDMEEDEINVMTLNETSINKEVPDETSNIIIGGHSLSRGLTIKNLIISFYVQDAKQKIAPTILQRARWFGYRADYFKWTRLFLTNDIFNTFSELLSVENKLWEYLLSDQNHDVNGLRRIFGKYKNNILPMSKNYGKYEITDDCFAQHDSNFNDIYNINHKNAFKWFNNEIIMKLKTKEIYKNKGIRDNKFSINEILESIKEYHNKNENNSVIYHIKRNLDYIKNDLKINEIRVICFLNDKEEISYKGSQRGWDLSKSYTPSGSSGSGEKFKMSDLNYSKLKKQEFGMDDLKVADLQLHPIKNNSQKNNNEYLFFSFFVNHNEKILNLIHK